MKDHRRYYRIGGITLQIEADLPMTDRTFHKKFKNFEVDGPGDDTVTVWHHFSLPDLINKTDRGEEIYRKPPWAIYKKRNSWIYVGISHVPEVKNIHKVAVFNNDHTRGNLYHLNDKAFKEGGNLTLTLLPTDQILLARILASRGGFFIHASGAILDGKGFLFVGHSDAGKSTMVTLLRDRVEILCDDRMIVRLMPEGFRIYGTWSHGDVSDVSPNSAPLRAVLFLEQAKENKLVLIEDRRQAVRNLLECLIKPLATAEWWEDTLSLIEKLSGEIPCYTVRFNKSGDIVKDLERL